MDKLVIDGGVALNGEVRISGAKKDELQAAITLVRKNVTDFPIQVGNFRD